MKHFGIFLADLESERFLSASNDQIATWLFLHAFCSKQMNGGTILDAATLPERFWSRHGITHSILVAESPLWSWNDSDLSVQPYDIQGQELYLKKSKGGIVGNLKRWKGTDNRTPNRTPNPPDQTRPDLTRPDQTSSSDEGGGLFSDEVQFPSKEDGHELFDYRKSNKESSSEGVTFAVWFKSTLPETMNLKAGWQQSFAECFDELVRLDNRSPEEIRAVCQWARTDSFWRSNFMSPSKLRDRKDGIQWFDVSTEKMKQPSGFAQKPANRQKEYPQEDLELP